MCICMCVRVCMRVCIPETCSQSSQEEACWQVYGRIESAEYRLDNDQTPPGMEERGTN